MRQIGKNIIFVFIFLIISSCLHKPASAALGIGRQVPGLSCGVGGAEKLSLTNDDPTACCTYKTVGFIRLPDPKIGPVYLHDAPIVGGIIKTYNEKSDEIDALQKDLAGAPCVFGEPKIVGSKCTCIASASTDALSSIRRMCSMYIKSGSELQKCLTCAIDKGGMYTGFGCTPLNVQEFIGNFLLSWGIGIAGGISLLCIIYSAFMMQTSMGNPEAIKKAQENLTACITGLILIIFSVFILRLIGVSILRIPFLQ